MAWEDEDLLGESDDLESAVADLFLGLEPYLELVGLPLISGSS